MTIYDRIRERREQLGMTQQELAEAVGYKTRSAINKIELGLRDISQQKVIDFANALNCSPSYLMGWEEEEEKWENIPFAMSAPEGYDALTEEGKRQIQELIKILPKKNDK